MVVANIAIPIGFLVAWINLPNHVKHPKDPLKSNKMNDPQTQTLMSIFIFLQLITVGFTVGGVQRFASHMSKVINGTINKIVVVLMIFSQLCLICLLATFFIFDLNSERDYLYLQIASV